MVCRWKSDVLLLKEEDQELLSIPNSLKILYNFEVTYSS